MSGDRDVNITTFFDNSEASFSELCSSLDDDRTIDRN